MRFLTEGTPLSLTETSLQLVMSFLCLNVMLKICNFKKVQNWLPIILNIMTGRWAPSCVAFFGLLRLTVESQCEPLHHQTTSMQHEYRRKLTFYPVSCWMWPKTDSLLLLKV